MERWGETFKAKGNFCHKSLVLRPFFYSKRCHHCQVSDTWSLVIGPSVQIWLSVLCHGNLAIGAPLKLWKSVLKHTSKVLKTCKCPQIHLWKKCASAMWFADLLGEVLGRPDGCLYVSALGRVDPGVLGGAVSHQQHPRDEPHHAQRSCTRICFTVSFCGWSGHVDVYPRDSKSPCSGREIRFAVHHLNNDLKMFSVQSMGQSNCTL